MYNKVIEVIIHLMKNLTNIQSGIKDLGAITENLATLGYTKEEINAAIIWVLKRLEQRVDDFDTLTYRPFRRKTYRVLHEFEQMVISPQAFGYIIQCKELGLINDEEVELIIEHAMNIGREIEADDVKAIMASILFDPELVGWQSHSMVMSSLITDKETIN